MKNKIIIANWKMNKTIVETKSFINELFSQVNQTENTVVLCVPFTDLLAAKILLTNTNIALGAQNVHWEENGAFTGEISPGMIIEAGAKYVIVGHSERRKFFGDTDQTISKRLNAAINSGLTPVFCVGETLEEREKDLTKQVLKKQIEIGTGGISFSDISKVVIAYEPVWAIGTGKNATAEDADETIGHIREIIGNIYNEAVAEKLPVLYGGSMNEKNASELLSMKNIDGGLIGGASLDSAKFAKIVNYR